MDRAIPDAIVTGHEDLIAGLTLPDPDDRHVLAAAIRCNASVIVTFNEKDFPAEALSHYAIETHFSTCSLLTRYGDMTFEELLLRFRCKRCHRSGRRRSTYVPIEHSAGAQPNGKSNSSRRSAKSPEALPPSRPGKRRVRSRG